MRSSRAGGGRIRAGHRGRPHCIAAHARPGPGRGGGGHLGLALGYDVDEAIERRSEAPRSEPDERAIGAQPAAAPKRAGLVLVSLILVAAVANLNLSVANVALPSIGAAFDSSQTTLNLIAVGYSLGLAASVLWLGAIGDRYGRKLLLVLGMLLSIPASLLAAYAPSDEVLFVARLVGGFSAGMAYPTTLALITALWAGPGGRARSRSGPPSVVGSRRSGR